MKVVNLGDSAKSMPRSRPSAGGGSDSVSYGWKQSDQKSEQAWTCILISVLQFAKGARAIELVTIDRGYAYPGFADGYSGAASRFSFATVFLPIPLTRSKSSHAVKSLLPPLASKMRAASTGPMFGSRTSDSGGAVEKNTRGSLKKRGGGLCDTVADFEGGKTFAPGTSCRWPERSVCAGPPPAPDNDTNGGALTVVAINRGSAIKQNRSQAPAIRRITTPNPPGPFQSKSCQAIPYTKVLGVIR